MLKDQPKIDIALMEQTLTYYLRKMQKILVYILSISIAISLLILIFNFILFLIILISSIFMMLFCLWYAKLWIHEFWLNKVKKLKLLSYEINSTELRIQWQWRDGSAGDLSIPIQNINSVKRRGRLRSILNGSRTSQAFSWFMIRPGEFLDVSFDKKFIFRHNIYLTPTSMDEFLEYLRSQLNRVAL